MKILIISILSLIPAASSAQLVNIKERLVEYNIPVDFLEHSIRNADRKFTFKYRMITGSPDGTPVIYEIEYNPQRKNKDRWRLISVNGNSPEKKEIRDFNRINNPRRKEVSAEIDESSYQVVVDNDQYFTYSFKYKEGSITSNRKFLEDCKGYVYINKKTGKIEGVRYENERETTVKMLKCTKIIAEYELEFHKATGMYLITGEEFEMTVKILGNEANLDSKGEYYDYTLIE